MSRPGKKRRLTSASQFHEEDVGEGLTMNPGAGGPEHRLVELERPELDGTVAAGPAAPPPAAWQAIAGQLELLQHTLGQLVITMAEVGSRAPTPATGSHAGQSGVHASSSAGVTRELGAILEVTPQPAAILCAARNPAAMLRAMPESAAMSAVMTAPMGAGAPAGAAGTSAAPQFAAASRLDAGPEATCGSDVAAAAVGTASGGAGGEWRPSGLPWWPQLRRLPPVDPFTAKGGDWLDFQARFEVAYESVGWPKKSIPKRHGTAKVFETRMGPTNSMSPSAMEAMT
ncbi:unnamed protein product [Lampetra fluviatilis]